MCREDGEFSFVYIEVKGLEICRWRGLGGSWIWDLEFRIEVWVGDIN